VDISSKSKRAKCTKKTRMSEKIFYRQERALSSHFPRLHGVHGAIFSDFSANGKKSFKQLFDCPFCVTGLMILSCNVHVRRRGFPLQRKSQAA
jgi:uncharacterized Fe-S cluster-containing radical SAM superfamily protein